jgi:uncharacterized protein
VELQHRFTVPASVDETWQAFNDLERVAPCFPGASLTSVEGDTFKGTVKIKLGPISMQYSGTGTFLERDEATHTARLEAKGKDKRGNGTASATVLARLLPEGDATAVEVSTDLAITGKPAQFGRGVIQDVSDKLLGRFTACLAETLSGPGEEEAADEPPVREPAAAPTPAPVSAPMPVPESAPTSAPVDAPVSTATAAGDAPLPGDGAVTGAPAPQPVRSAPSAVNGSFGAAPAGVAGDEGLDLIRTVAPVLARRFALPVGGALLVLWVLIRLVRR